MKQRDRLTSLFWAGVGLYIVYEGYRLKLGTLGSPNCGFFIFWTGLVLTGLSLVLFSQTLLGPKEAKDRRALWERLRWSKGAKMMGTVVVQRERRVYVPKYERFKRTTHKYSAHSPPCMAVSEGAKVTIAECRPLSKTVKFVVVKVHEGK